MPRIGASLGPSQLLRIFPANAFVRVDVCSPAAAAAFPSRISLPDEAFALLQGFKQPTKRAGARLPGRDRSNPQICL